MSREMTDLHLDNENFQRIERTRGKNAVAKPSARPQQPAKNRSALTDLDNNHASAAAAASANNNANLRLHYHHTMASPFVTHPDPNANNAKAFTIRPDDDGHHKEVTTAIASVHVQSEDESRRMSLKRQADSAELMDTSRPQDAKKLKVEQDYEWDNLDAEDADDPLMVSEYVNDIFEYLHELETRTLPDANYLHWQRNLRPKMRSILVDWMVEVHLKFRLLPETLYLSINIMDRFMSRETVQVDRLQLLATGSLFIAAKYEEVYSPSVKNYAFVTDGGFSEDEILQAERFILEILNFDMSYPNPMNFLRRISKADDYDVQARTIGKYLLEITAVDHKFIGYMPSLCAAASMYIARKMLGKFEWTGNLIHYSGGYREADMKELCEMLMDYLISPIVHEEFFKKYASRRFMKVSILARQWAKKITREGKNIMDPVI